MRGLRNFLASLDFRKVHNRRGDGFDDELASRGQGVEKRQGEERRMGSPAAPPFRMGFPEVALVECEKVLKCEAVRRMGEEGVSLLIEEQDGHTTIPGVSEVLKKGSRS